MTRSAMRIDLTIRARTASLAGISLGALEGHAVVTPTAWTFDAVRFGIFGGRYDGALTLTLEDTPAFRLNAVLSDLDMGTLMAFAGRPGLVTGRLSGQVDANGRGADATAVLSSMQGSLRVDLTEGVVRNLGLVRGVVLATSMRDDSRAALDEVSADEPFSRLGATLAVDGGVARTDDLRFESANLEFFAQGSLALDGSTVNLEGPVRLSEALSAQAGRDLVRHTREGGKVMLPAAVTGSAANLQVRIDLANLTRRAIVNRATEEAEDAIRRGLGGLVGR